MDRLTTTRAPAVQKTHIRVCTIDIVYTVDKVDSVDNVNNMMWLKLIIWVGTLRIANLRIAY